MLLDKKESLAMVLENGVIIWRPVAFSSVSRSMNESCRLIRADSIFRPAPEGGFMARVAIPGCFIPEPELIPAQTRDGHPRSGLVVFVKQLPPSHWTHLRITGLSKRLREETCLLAGGAIFAEFARPYDATDYAQFRINILKAKIAAEYKEGWSADTLFDEIENVWPEDVREDAKRLLIHRTNNEDTPWAYGILTEDAE